MTIYIDGHNCQYEIRCLAGMFFPGLSLAEREGKPGEGDPYIYTGVSKTDTQAQLTVEVSIGRRHRSGAIYLALPQPNFKNACERAFGQMLYPILADITGVKPKWGVLTGIRPVKLVQERLDKGMLEEDVLNHLQSAYLVSEEKSHLMVDTARMERGALDRLKGRGNTFSLYIGIPFCPSRCLYCSFVSHSIEKSAKLIPDYVEKLCEEIKHTAEIADELGLSLSTVYIGGGTPTALTAPQLAQIFDAVKASFGLSGLWEYTVEAGRADTITADKLITIKDGGASRISINPQTLNDQVLAAIGRKHTAQEVLDSFALARQIGFDNINMDLIAGLHSDTLPSFRKTVDGLLELAPENITIHTLSVKRSSDSVYEGTAIYDAGGGLADSMLDYAYMRLAEEGYRPYYLYRQKNTRDNLENVGFCRKGKMGLYNIYMMEEVQTILACGAGAVTKLVDPERSYIERVFNYKLPLEYLRGFDTLLKRKAAITSFYSR